MSVPRLLYANLDAEADLARLTHPAGASRPRRSPPRRLREVLASFGALLAIFAEEGDELRLVATFDPERLAPIPGLPRPRFTAGRLTAGRLTGGERPSALLAWAETSETLAVRRRLPRWHVTDLDAPLHELVWRLPAAAPEVVARVNHRAFALELAEKLGVALPGARTVASLEILEAHLAARDEINAWVVKAPLSAAGRERLVHRGGPLDGKGRRIVEGLFARHGELLFEPWMDRVEDFGVVGVVGEEGARIVGTHRLLVDAVGRFRGVEIEDPHPPAPLQITTATAHALRAAGYTGPFGIDAWTYRRGEGAVVPNPLGEINARLTFGHVAHAFVERLRGPLGLDDGARLRFHFGREAPAGGRLLVRPGAEGFGVWLVHIPRDGPVVSE